MAHSIAPVSSSRSSLIKPLEERAILVHNEQVYYAARQHWASVVQPVYETFIFLLFIIWIVDAAASTGMGSRWITGALILAVVHAISLSLTKGRPPSSRLAIDPFSNPSSRTSERTIIIGFVLVALGSLAWLGPRASGITAVVVIISRLIVILARWSFYERRFITNRRVIESGGFLGSRISSMPLSRVTDISYKRTVPGELFGYASMRVETAGQDQALGVVRFIADPGLFYEVLINFSAPEPLVDPHTLNE